MTRRPLLILALILAPSLAQAGEEHYREAAQAMARWQREHPDLVKARVIGRSVEGRPLTVLRIGASAKADLPGLYFGASIHGSERSHEDLLAVIDDLLRRRKDKAIADLLRSRALWVQPMMNPDGVFHSQRKNAAGVDLNRNFGYRWGEWPRGVPGQRDRRYPGPEPFSEPETRALKKFLSEEASIVLFFDLHRSARLVLAPYGVEDEQAGADVLDLARGLDRAMSGRWSRRGRYQIREVVPGGSGYTVDWVYASLGIPALTLEFPYRSNARDRSELRSGLGFLMRALGKAKRRTARRWF